MNVRMRDDLALDGLKVPAFAYIDSREGGMEATYLSADELVGAKCLPDLCDDTSLEYSYNRIGLRDGRIFFMVGVDLDWDDWDHGE